MFAQSQQIKAFQILQSQFPLKPYPFLEVAKQIGISEHQLLNWVQEGIQGGFIRRLSASFNARAMGYTSVLVAAAVAPDKIENVAAFVNQNPGVTHNYERDHGFNLWFTLTVSSETSKIHFLEQVRARQGVTQLLELPALEYYKLNVVLDPETGENRAQALPQPIPNSPAAPVSFSPQEKSLIRLLQKQIPLCSRPFYEIGQLVGISERDVLLQISAWKKLGILRKLGLVFHHRKMGATANAMVVWRVDEHKSREVGEIMAAFPQVSHCYRRLTYPQWPYSHYTMIHAGREQKLEQIIQAISAETGIGDFMVLRSGREFKKVGMQYFEESPSESSEAATAAHHQEG